MGLWKGGSGVFLRSCFSGGLLVLAAHPRRPEMSLYFSGRLSLHSTERVVSGAPSVGYLLLGCCEKNAQKHTIGGPSGASDQRPALDECLSSSVRIRPSWESSASARSTPEPQQSLPPFCTVTASEAPPVPRNRGQARPTTAQLYRDGTHTEQRKRRETEAKGGRGATSQARHTHKKTHSQTPSCPRQRSAHTSALAPPLADSRIASCLAFHRIRLSD